MTANPRLAKAETGVSPQRRKGRQGEQPGEEMEVKFFGLQSPSWLEQRRGSSRDFRRLFLRANEPSSAR
jgi:hypothetical protein